MMEPDLGFCPLASHASEPMGMSPSPWIVLIDFLSETSPGKRKKIEGVMPRFSRVCSSLSVSAFKLYLGERAKLCSSGLPGW